MGLQVELAEIKTEVKNLNKDVTELKGSTKAQIWTLIGILVTAVSGFFSRCSQIRLLSHSLTFFLERVASRSLFLKTYYLNSHRAPNKTKFQTVFIKPGIE